MYAQALCTGQGINMLLGVGSHFAQFALQHVKPLCVI